MENQERIFESKVKGAPIGIEFDRKEVESHSYILEDKDGNRDKIVLFLSKKLAEKYLAQLSKALEDLDRQKDEHRGIK